jgi:hypothetical protein
VNVNVNVKGSVGESGGVDGGVASSSFAAGRGLTRCTVLDRAGLVDWAAHMLPGPPGPTGLPRSRAALFELMIPQHGALVRLESWLRAYDPVGMS